MPNTITNFLVGIGFDYDEDATKQIGSGIDSVKSKALQLGAVVAGAFGIKALTSDFAGANDQLGKFSQVFGVTADDISAIGRALAAEGGSIESFISQISGLEKLRAGTLQGDFGFVAAAQLAGVDTDPFLKATTATEAYLALAKQFKTLSQQQRINAAAAFGLDEASIRLLSRGRDGIEALVEKQRLIRPVTDAMTKSSAEFNRQMLDLTNNIGGFADRISERLLPQINNVVAGMNDWISANRELINMGVGGVADAITDNPAGALGITTALTAGALTSSASLLGKIPGVGGPLAGAARFGGGALGIASAGLLGAAIGAEINKHLSLTTKDVIGRSIAEILAFFGNDEARATIERNAQRENEIVKQPIRQVEGLTNQINAIRKQKINLTVQIGNETIDKRVIEVNERQNQITLNDLESTNGG